MLLPTLISENAAMQTLLRVARDAARAHVTVAIAGETGTGKELLARYIHEQSARKHGPFVAVNCTAFPETLWEAELFGYERGAFTGAIEGKAGKFELAHGGTLFLDEIGDMPAPLQAKLLRVLQEKEVDRLGSRRPTPIDVRVVTATHRNLRQLVADGTFREDLYYRLYVFPLMLPPLRERTEDIPCIAQEFFRQRGLHHYALRPDAIDALQAHAWPGNIRELLTILERALVYACGEAEIIPAHLSFDPPLFTAQENESTTSASPLQHVIRQAEQTLIRTALQQTGNRRDHAAKLLGMSPRTLRHKLSKRMSAEQ